MAARRIEVAAAVIVRDDGRFLLAQRPPGKPYAGYWEFPGGKVEEGESAHAALCRELHEELGIDVDTAYPWITRDYDYEHAAVRLRFFRVVAWHGTLHGKEAQAFAWQSSRELTVSPILPANGPILRALDLPAVYGISNVAGLGAEEFLRRAERAFEQGLRLVQLREPALALPERFAIARELIRRAHRYQARVLFNGETGQAAEVGADGVHLNATRLLAAKSRPDVALVGASCHNRAELDHAASIGVDFIVLGPVAATPSHPQARTLGWDAFASLLRGYSVPVYALGGMREADCIAAWRAGAHGVSMLRGAWE